jgi:thiamine monophosphate synthase
MTSRSLPFALVKAIAGIQTQDRDTILAVVQATEQSTAQAVDIPMLDAALVSQARALTQKLLVVSAMDVQALVSAAQAGADVLELGNYDALYAEGQFISAAQVLETTQALGQALQQEGLSAGISVTIPGYLSAQEQTLLAQAVAQVPQVVALQTEGALRQLSAEPQVQSLPVSHAFERSLSNTAALAQATALPVWTATGVTPENAEFALAAGASGVGMGRSLRQAASVEAMVLVLNQTVAALQAVAVAVA